MLQKLTEAGSELFPPLGARSSMVRWLALPLLLVNLSCELQQGIAQTSEPEPAAVRPERQRRANRLAGESSPYLRAHAHNPVDWYPWGPAALEKARRENKPIFLSIGYSSCYWCHVMERQVFENEEIAESMNEHFVNIKVDREERPDLDDIYMLSLQVYLQLAGSSQGGGWPLSIFLTPDGKPIAGGTYFPPEDMPGRPGFPSVMKQIQTAWAERREDVQSTAEVVSREVQRLSQPPLDLKATRLGSSLVQGAVEAATAAYDPEHGGFDFKPDAPESPKFPVPSKIQLLQMQVAARAESAEKSARMIDHTLERLAAGGIRDHLGGGFHRYSVDRYWLVPHFEKMLYDNAQLAEVYVDAHRRTSRQSDRELAESVLDFVLREMRDARGGFYSALDAETDGIEGKYYVWSKEEIEKVLAPDEIRIFFAAYGLNREQSFEHGYVLNHPQPLSTVADELGISLAELKTRLSGMRKTLLKLREKRDPLLTDDKCLTSWNGLTIRAFARAGKTFQRRDYLEAAEKGALFVLSTLRDKEGRLLRSARNGEAKLPGYLDDYAFLVSGLLALHEATGEDKWLSAARRLTDDQINLFWDSRQGGFFFTSHDHETLIARMKSAYDSVLPSGNSVSVQNLVRLARLTSENAYRQRAEQTLQAFALHLESTPGNLPYMALALQEYLHWYGPEASESTAGDLFSGGVSSPMPRPSQPERGDGPGEQEAEQPLVALRPDDEEAGKHETIAVRGYLSVDKLPAGGTCRIAIEIDVADGWHVNANPPRPDFVIPTQLTLQSGQGIELSQVRYPQGKDFRLEGFDEPLSVYEGTVYLVGTLEVPAETVPAGTVPAGTVPAAEGAADLTVQLRYQACNNQSCLRPMRIILSGRVPLAPRDAVRAANEKLFERLAVE